MVGSVIVRTLEQQDQTYIVTRTHASPHMGDGAQQLVWVCCSQQKGQFND